NSADAIAGTKLNVPPSSFLPYLIYEYGLGELTPYVPNLYALIKEGIAWQRVRGTLRAVSMGLNWLGLKASLEEAWTGRRFWNSYQLRFATLPEKDAPDLERIEAISSLSTPLRSKLRRGVYQYDVGPLIGDRTRLDGSMLEFESGIKATAGTLNFPEAAIWSFGRTVEFSHTLTEAEGLSLGNWLPPVAGGVLAWINAAFPWKRATAEWAATPEEQRRQTLASWFNGKVLHLVLRDADNKPIGYRRCRTVRPVGALFTGPYRIGVDRYAPKVAGGSVYIEAMTQFGDVSDRVTTSIAVVVGGTVAAGVPIGRLWLEPGQLSGGVEIMAKAVSIPLRKTVRDQFKFLLGF
ncbi:phage tail protein, partial [Escherichia coli]|uniref:phage tail protein n=2 Tax=Escherichia coli TaxID=562 RepID=UPI003CFCB007